MIVKGKCNIEDIQISELIQNKRPIIQKALQNPYMKIVKFSLKMNK